MSKSAAITIAIFVVVFLGGFVLINSQKTTDNINYDDYDASTFIEPSADNGHIGDHYLGSRDAKAVLVQYFDFSCGMCAQSHTTLEDYIAEKGENVAIIMRNYPIQSSHPNSFAAASAAEAAGFIKKSDSVLASEETQSQIAKGLIDDTYYFEMVGTLLKNQTVWYTASASARTDIIADLFTRIAPEADIDEFLAHMGSSEVKDKVNFDFAIGNHQGVTGTPAFLLNGEHLTINNLSAIETVLKPAVEAILTSPENN